jgi:hypothetical protein
LPFLPYGDEAERRGFRKIITIIDFERARESMRECPRASQMIDTGDVRGKLLLKVAELSA